MKRSTPDELEREVEIIREEMEPVIQELDTRRHELVDWRLQLKRNRGKLVKASAVVLGLFFAAKLVRRNPLRIAGMIKAISKLKTAAGSPSATRLRSSR